MLLQVVREVVHRVVWKHLRPVPTLDPSSKFFEPFSPNRCKHKQTVEQTPNYECTQHWKLFESRVYVSKPSFGDLEFVQIRQQNQASLPKPASQQSTLAFVCSNRPPLSASAIPKSHIRFPDSHLAHFYESLSEVRHHVPAVPSVSPAPGTQAQR